MVVSSDQSLREERDKPTLAEDLFERIGDACGRVGPGLALLLSQNTEESDERFGDGVVADVQGLSVQEGNGFCEAHELLVLLHNADPARRFLHNGLGCLSQSVTCLCPEILGG